MKKLLVLAFALVSAAYGVETPSFSLSKEATELVQNKDFSKALAGKGREEFITFIEKFKEGSQAALETVSFTIDEQSKTILLSSFFELIEKNLMWALATKFSLEQELNNVLQVRLLSSLDPKNEATRMRVQQEEILFAQTMEKRGSAISEQEVEKLIKGALAEVCDVVAKKLKAKNS
jgi:hypothetical protein